MFYAKEAASRYVKKHKRKDLGVERTRANTESPIWEVRDLRDSGRPVREAFSIGFTSSNERAMSNDPKEARQDLKKFEQMVEDIEDYLPDTEHYSYDDGTEWESVE